MLAASLLFLAPPPAAAIFDQTVAAHARLTRIDATVTTETKLNAEDLKSSAHVLFISPDKLRLTVQEPEQNGRAASRRIYTLFGGRFVAVDDFAREYTERQYPFPAGLPISQRLAATLGSPGDAVNDLLDSKSLENFFSSFRNLTDLTITKSGGIVELRRHIGKAKIAFDIGIRDHLLHRVRLDNAAGFLSWQFAYGAPPSSIGAPSLSGLKKVDSLVAREAPPIYASQAARALAKKSQFAYDNLHSVACRFEAPDGSGRFWSAGGRYRQDTGAKWVYASKVLTAKNSGGVFSGRMALVKVSSALRAVGIPVQAMLLQLMQHRNPMGALLATKSHVRLAGEINLDGGPCGILEVRANGITVEVTVRKSDGMILSTRASIPGRQGVVIHQETSYTYESVNRPMPAGTFAKPAGSAKAFPKS